jgi:hypothetical protein
MEAITVGQRHLGADHPSLAAPLNELSRCTIRQSDFVRAEPVLERLLRIARTKGEHTPTSPQLSPASPLHGADSVTMRRQSCCTGKR